MKITSLSAQIRNPDRVNVSVDGAYRFSLDITQVTELGVKVGREVSSEELAEFENESQFGKLYARALEYCLMRPHSVKEVRDYLWKKTRDRRGKEGRVVQGYSPALADRVLERLRQKSYVDDEKFARWWVENRNVTKGTSLRKLSTELAAKGIARETIETVLGDSERSDEQELAKIVAKKRARYPDDQKFMQYLARQGFRYDDIVSALHKD